MYQLMMLEVEAAVVWRVVFSGALLYTSGSEKIMMLSANRLSSPLITCTHACTYVHLIWNSTFTRDCWQAVEGISVPCCWELPEQIHDSGDKCKSFRITMRMCGNRSFVCFHNLPEMSSEGTELWDFLISISAPPAILCNVCQSRTC